MYIFIKNTLKFGNKKERFSALLDFYSTSFRDSLAALDRDKTYLIYCRSDNRTGRAIGIMRELGFKKIYELRGGIKSWLSSGRTLQVQ